MTNTRETREQIAARLGEAEKWDQMCGFPGRNGVWREQRIIELKAALAEAPAEPTEHKKDKLTHERTVLGCIACDLTDTDHVEGKEVDDPRPAVPGPQKCPWCHQVLVGSTERVSEPSADSISNYDRS